MTQGVSPSRVELVVLACVCALCPGMTVIAFVMNAINDALGLLGARVTAMRLTPKRILRALVKV